MHLSYRRALAAAGIFAAAGLTSLAAFVPAARAEMPSLPPQLEKLRAAMDKYRDPYVAVRDGYFSTVGCVYYPKGGEAGHVGYKPGGMGVHFINMKLVGPKPDPMRPALLVYEPKDGKLELAAVEWFVPLATGIKERPSVHGQKFDGPMEGHEPLLPKGLHHYDLHAWLWKTNSYGLFAPTNPDVKCDGYGYALAEHAPPLVKHDTKKK
jgi:hypothetical protein